jgi:DNA replication protein DnaC
MADFDWTWPAKIERDIVERALALDFLHEARNLVLAGTNGLGKTMIAQNVCHAAAMAGSSVLFRFAPALQFIVSIQIVGSDFNRLSFRSRERTHRHGRQG